MYPSPIPPSFPRDRFSVFSHSLGDHSAHKLPYKLTAAALSGFPAVEISLIDLEDHATQKGCNLLESAQEIGELCRVLGLRVTCIQPLRDVIESRKPVSDGVEKAMRLFPVMDALDTDLLLVCSSSLPPDQLDPSTESAVAHLKAIGTAAAAWKPKKRVAFEALAWGTHINLWRQAWDVVQAVDLKNVGICLDSFNTLAREWADPTVPGGIQPNAHNNIRRSMSQLGQLPGRKIFLLQIGDGAKLKEPIARETCVEAPPLMTWSRSSRLFPMEVERGGYLPVAEFVAAVIKTRYSGYWSLEVFNNSLSSPIDSTPVTHALRGFHGLSKLANFIFANPQVDHEQADQTLIASPSSLQLIAGIPPSYQLLKPPSFRRSPQLNSDSASDSSSLEFVHESDPEHPSPLLPIHSTTSPRKLCNPEIHALVSFHRTSRTSDP
ncbi:hypothetical protein PCANC_28077 [Puccinia coronata f. sp. avenae]|uniref:Xylose isomerase-like TIM barrel domain-containing protein n=1 Tax=Puccinia coronata f. sp. avenae TaxID=200324 RepID=A0A2N5UYV0_9BASI|nr:hypothetical protein PCANC_28077 [Puccinia coronata f. sp. avenae]PLW42877.1 hypothetical protein PCASD_07235 [Puccinia coronata f. sp. avenae]